MSADQPVATHKSTAVADAAAALIAAHEQSNKAIFQANTTLEQELEQIHCDLEDLLERMGPLHEFVAMFDSKRAEKLVAAMHAIDGANRNLY